jgi:hypothetical protein
LDSCRRPAPPCQPPKHRSAGCPFRPSSELGRGCPRHHAVDALVAGGGLVESPPLAEAWPPSRRIEDRLRSATCLAHTLGSDAVLSAVPALGRSRLANGGVCAPEAAPPGVAPVSSV